MMKNIIVIGIVVAMAVGFVITGSTPTAVSAQGNMTAGDGNMTAGGGDIVQQLKAAAAVAELIDNKKMFIIACEPSMTDPDTQCVVANLEMR
jgi:tetrahydromethanopterin S-methyltransferase subunit D